MTDESAEALPQVKRPAKRHFRPLTNEQWKLARIQFETSDEGMTLVKISQLFQTSLSAVQKRSAKEQWSKGAKIVSDARQELQLATTKALAVAAEKTGAEVAKRLMDDLQPWIEREKRTQIKRAIKRSKRAHSRLDTVAKGYTVYDAKRGTTVELEPCPKDEMHIASAEEKYDAIIRRNLGMSDDKTTGGSLALNILTGQAAVQIVSNPA